MREMMAILRALDNENRLRIVLSLRGGEVCLCQLIEVLELAPSTVSKHVDLLRQAGLVEMRKEGRWHYYRLAGRDASPAAREAIRWISRSLQDEHTIAGDLEKLKTVCAGNPEEWTACYTRN
jgi:ArsR family transcriptional regulator, arsenate/arsenite/antimonite-responsive transcriptional repressor